MLKAAIKEQLLGCPWEIETDIGPIIDKKSYDAISQVCSSRTKRWTLNFFT